MASSHSYKMKISGIRFLAALASLVFAGNLLAADTTVPTKDVLDGGSPDAVSGGTVSKAKEVAPVEPEAEILARTKWWKDATFGMFIHWGLYSAYAGEYKGESIPRNGEWIQFMAKIPEPEYAASAKQFNPVKFNADEWVAVAKSAGMKYIVFTAKHHDGFCMFDTKLSDFNIVKATPFHRDPVRELYNACKKAGIRFGVYYSNDLDWHENMWGLEPHDGKDPVKFDKYYREKSMGQVKELLTNYGPMAMVFFDGHPKASNVEQGLAFRQMIRKLQPDCIINNRLRSVPGDYVCFERGVPKLVDNRLWELNNVTNGTWGFKKKDTSWKSPAFLVFQLVDVVSKGGNYLLNVGPTGEGIIPEANVKIFQELGAWLKVNGEAVYGAGRTPFGDELGAYSTTEKDAKGKPVFNEAKEWRCTTKPGKLYITLFKWPAGTFELKGLKGKATKAALLADPAHKPLAFKQTGADVTVTLPEKAPDALGSVLCLDLAAN